MRRVLPILILLAYGLDFLSYFLFTVPIHSQVSLPTLALWHFQQQGSFILLLGILFLVNRPPSNRLNLLYWLGLSLLELAQLSAMYFKPTGWAMPYWPNQELVALVPIIGLAAVYWPLPIKTRTISWSIAATALALHPISRGAVWFLIGLFLDNSIYRGM